MAGYLLVLLLFIIIYYYSINSLDVFSLFHRLIYVSIQIKNIWLPPGIETRTAWGTAMPTVSLSTDQRNSSFSIYIYMYQHSYATVTLNRPTKFLFSKEKEKFCWSVESGTVACSPLNSIKNRIGVGCWLVVVAQWQSACALYKRSGLIPVTTKYF